MVSGKAGGVAGIVGLHPVPSTYSSHPPPASHFAPAATGLGSPPGPAGRARRHQQHYQREEGTKCRRGRVGSRRPRQCATPPRRPAMPAAATNTTITTNPQRGSESGWGGRRLPSPPPP